MRIKFFSSGFLLVFLLSVLWMPCAFAQQQKPAYALLTPANYRHYTTQFAADEKEATGNVPADAWPWMAANIPLFEASNKQFEQTYYFRWYAFSKHVVEARPGFIITEWMPKPERPDGFFGALPDAAPFHLGEARWLRNPRIAAEYARLWLQPEAGPRKYSFPLADSVRNVVLATGNRALGEQMLPGLIENYKAWEGSNLDASVGLYWQIDTRDAMEKSISGDGYRTPLNSYQSADAAAIAEFAALAGDATAAREFAAKSAALRRNLEKLWNPRDGFYESMSPASESGIRKQK